MMIRIRLEYLKSYDTDPELTLESLVDLANPKSPGDVHVAGMQVQREAATLVDLMMDKIEDTIS